MGIFGRKKSHKRSVSNSFQDARKSVVISKMDQDKLKVRTIGVHDPILNAINEQQPFQEATMQMDASKLNSLSMMASKKPFNDAFGNPIVRGDMSNPTRPRDERPMDTIRSFEYAISGDPFYKSNLETPLYGWNVRPTYLSQPGNLRSGDMMPNYQTNPYDNYANQNHSTIPRTFEQPVYQPKKKEPEQKKKKRGLFGKSKKNKA